MSVGVTCHVTVKYSEEGGVSDNKRKGEWMECSYIYSVCIRIE